MEEKGEQIACVIVEPVAGNMGLVAPAEGFLETLRELTEQKGSLLIFDEVMTGFPGGGFSRDAKGVDGTKR
jgi:glutamate-1-semialdehyde 2,1-aminomutase